MLDILDIIAPIFLLVGAGYGAAKFGLIDGAGARALGAVVLYIAFPSLIVSAFVTNGVAQILDWRLLLAYGAAGLGSFGILALWMRAKGRPASRIAAAGLGASGPNSGFIGFPLISLALGAEVAAAILANALIIESAVLIPLALGIAGGAGAGRRAALRRMMLEGVLRNPMIIAIAIGAFLSLSGIGLPGPVGRAAAIMSAASTPMALLALGVALALMNPGEARRDFPEVIAAKLLLHPALAFATGALMASQASLPEARWIGVALTSASPMMTIYPIIGRRIGEESWAARTLFLAMLGSVATLSFWIWLLV